ncbi:MAG: arginine--tRNA ligase [Patescibacteria group bacterium]
MESAIKQLINTALTECFGLADVSFAVERPKELSHGDYATNAALTVSKQLGKNPLEVAQVLFASIDAKKPESIASVSIAGPGFINFSLSSAYFNTALKNILEQKKEWGASDIYNGKHILVEHSSPNLFKAFHIGHVMNNAIGESIARLAKYSGATVKVISFPSDISLGVAKAVFILLEKHGADFVPTSVEELGDAYVEGTKRYEDDESVLARVKEIANNIYSHTASPELQLFETCKKFNIAYFEHITARLGSHFDGYIYESEAGVAGKRIVQDHTPTVFTESEGAIVYVPDEARKDINTAVFINSRGNPTYEAKDIGLLSMKFAADPIDLSIFITDNQQVSHFNVVLDAAAKIAAEWAEKSVHVHHGRMSFKGQKMSSRLGGVPLAETLIDTITEETKEKNASLSVESTDAIAIAALKFSILRAMAGKDINFDPETSLSFEGDSGPYLQYSTVRAVSVLQKAGDTSSLALPEGWQATDLEKILIHFPEIVENAIKHWSPHFVVTYLLELAQAFNSWYGNTKIIDAADPASAYKLSLTKAFTQTMTNGLYLLGISVPEKM